MTDTCLACGRVIFTVRINTHITLDQQWTHGGYGIVDRQHTSVPSKPENLQKTTFHGRNR